MDIFFHILFYDFLKFFLLINTPYGHTMIFTYVERYFAVSFLKYLCLNLYLSKLNYKYIFDVTHLVVDVPCKLANFCAHVLFRTFFISDYLDLECICVHFFFDRFSLQ